MESLRSPEILLREIREELFQNPYCHPQLLSVFHILDSLAMSSPAKKEAKQLQNIFLNHFEEETFEEGRVAVNIPKVDALPLSAHNNSLNWIGAYPTQQRGLCLFCHIFWEKILSKPRFYSSSH